MGRASRRKRERRGAPESFKVWDELANQRAARVYRRHGKVATFSMMYGGPMMQNITPLSVGLGARQRQLAHPLEFQTAFRLTMQEADKRFGHTFVYKSNTKMIGEIMGRGGTHVPDTDVWVRSVHELTGMPHGTSTLTAIAWCRRHKLTDIQHAVAWLLMQDKVPVVVRAFEP